MQSVNLMPPGYADTQRAKRRLILGIGVAIALLLVMVGVRGLVRKRIGDRAHARELLEERLGELKAAKADLAVGRKRLRGLAGQFLVVRTLERNRRWASYVGHVARAANPSIVLSRVHVAPRSPATGGRAEPRTSTSSRPAAAGRPESPERLVLLIEGYALSNTDVYQFINALRETRMFERVNFKGSRATHLRLRKVSRFELECPVRYASGAGPPAPAAAAEVAADLDRGRRLLDRAGRAEGGGGP
ncbi:MAG: PilN domain-containing protein [Planctomycetota bacterium]